MAIDDLFKKQSPQRKHACTVVSMLPFQLLEEKPHMLPSAFLVPAAEDGRFGILHVEEGTHYIPNPLIEEGKPGSNIKQTTLSEDMAKSIVDDYSTAQVALSEDGGPGIFWVSGRLSQSEILKQYPELVELYDKRQRTWFRNLCALADADWQKNKNMLAVSDLQRAAAKVLGIQKDWVDFRVEETASCKMCKIAINPEAIVCSGCGYILKPELYKKEEFANVRG